MFHCSRRLQAFASYGSAPRLNCEVREADRDVKRVANVIVALLTALSAFSVHGQPTVDPQPCSGEVMAVVAAALKHALVDARDLPDLLIVEQSDPVRVSDYLWGNECLLAPAVLPTSRSGTYALLGRDEARDMANQRGEPIIFARAGQVEVAEEEASVWVGASLRPADGDERAVTCCCGGQMFLRREAGRWVFARWGMQACA